VQILAADTWTSEVSTEHANELHFDTLRVKNNSLDDVNSSHGIIVVIVYMLADTSVVWPNWTNAKATPSSGFNIRLCQLTSIIHRLRLKRSSIYSITWIWIDGFELISGMHRFHFQWNLRMHSSRNIFRYIIILYCE